MSEIYWKLANFAILAGALGYFIHKKAGAFFRSRSEAIRRDIEEADRLSREAEERAAEIERRMNNLDAEIEAFRGNSRGEMAAENERLRQETEASLKKIQEQAQQEIASAAKAARHEVSAHAAELAVRLAAGKIRLSLTRQADDSLVASFLDNLDQTAGANPAKEIN